LCAALADEAQCGEATVPRFDSVQVKLADGAQANSSDYAIETTTAGASTQFTLRNLSDSPLVIAEIVLADWRHGLPSSTLFYGEGYTMLSQMGGTLGQPVDLGEYTDRAHYKLPQPAGFTTVYGMMTLSPPGGMATVLGFSSCRRFVGKFHVNDSRIQVVLATEGATLGAGESWKLEELFFSRGTDRNELLRQLADAIGRHHPRQQHRKLPTGWCSWYCFGPNVTAQNVRENLQVMSRKASRLTYVQIDDGYQPWMGDWLDTGKAFGGGVQVVLEQIESAGFEPAIWVAPFVASPESQLFKRHPDWFVKDRSGQPLRSDKFTFGGWRLGPWYMLDGTHPQAQDYLEQTFRTMREDWGCTYFKLDANTWGALPEGVRHDPTATSVEAYRQGMAAIRRGSEDAFLLGCNHPMWPSLGEVHGSRSSRDVRRHWKTIRGLSRENLMRNWQNNRLWWNDPDCLVISGGLTADERTFHLTATFASGGMLLSSDDLTKLSDDQLAHITRCIPDPGNAAEFLTEKLEVGFISHPSKLQPDAQLAVALNWGDSPVQRSIPLQHKCRVVDYWTDEDLGVHQQSFELPGMPPHSGRLLRLLPE